MEGPAFFFSSLFFAEIDISHLVAEEGGSYMDQFMSMILTLGLVLGLILVTLWVLKKFMLSRNRHLNSSTSIQILERRALSPKNSLYLIQVESKKILVSDSPTGVSLICDSFPQEESVVAEEGVLLDKPTFPDIISNKLKGLFIKNA